jgi:transcriptional regulator with XRE-family HTH domain
MVGRLRATRRDAGISHARLAAVLGVSEATLAGWEAGRHRPSDDSLYLWALLLGERVPAGVGRLS